MYSTELKMKRLSLAAEARTIHTEERQLKAKGEGNSLKFNSIHHHRLHIVRSAARAAHLAHVFLRKRAYTRSEDPKTMRTKPSLDGIVQNVMRFGKLNISKEEVRAAIKAWMEPEVQEGAQPVLVGASNP